MPSVHAHKKIRCARKLPVVPKNFREAAFRQKFREKRASREVGRGLTTRERSLHAQQTNTLRINFCDAVKFAKFAKVFCRDSF